MKPGHIRTIGFLSLISVLMAACVSVSVGTSSAPMASPKMLPTNTATVTSTATPVVVRSTPVPHIKFTEIPYDPASWTAYPLNDYMPPNWVGWPTTATSIAILSSKKAWVGTHDGLWKYDNGKWTAYLEKNGMLADSVNTLAIGPDGRVWVGSFRGISIFDGRAWQTISGPAGIRDIKIARNGDVWISQWETETTPAALLEYSNRLWQDVWVGGESPSQYSWSDTDHVTSITTTLDGAVWFGTMRNGIFMLKGKAWTHYPMEVFNGEFGENPSLVRDFAVAPDGTIWALIGMTGGAAAHFDGKSWTSYPFRSPDGDGLEAIAVSPKDRVWLGEMWGRTISFMDAGNWYSFSNLPFDAVYDIQVAADGSTWFATSGGLYIYTGR